MYAFAISVRSVRARRLVREADRRAEGGVEVDDHIDDEKPVDQRLVEPEDGRAVLVDLERDAQGHHHDAVDEEEHRDDVPAHALAAFRVQEEALLLVNHLYNSRTLAAGAPRPRGWVPF